MIGASNTEVSSCSLRLSGRGKLIRPFPAAVLVDRINQALSTEAKRRVVLERLDSLTNREKEFLELLVTGKNVKQISLELGISSKTGNIHRANVLNKMHVENVTELVEVMRSY